MQRELDELLRELDDLPTPSASNRPSASPAVGQPPPGRSTAVSPVQSIKAASPRPLAAAGSLDLSVDELLKSLDVPSLSQDGAAAGSRSLGERTSFNNVRNSKHKCRCSQVFLAGSAAQHGWQGGASTAAVAAVGCSALRCTKCDCSVVRLVDVMWTEVVDYLFLRNRYPDVAQLMAGARRSQGASAYCCQCSWTVAKGAATRVDQAAEQLRWVCGGHDPTGV